MLLWALILAGYSTAAVWVHRRRQPELAPHAAAVLQTIMAFFLGVMVFSSKPFVTLDFTPEAIAEIARLAAEINERIENIGARRLHTVMERLVEEISFTASDRDGETLVIDPAYVQATVGQLIEGADLSKFIL